MFYSDTQSFLNFLTILNRLEVGVFDRAVKLDFLYENLYCGAEEAGRGDNTL
jgi:hypothetical protein